MEVADTLIKGIEGNGKWISSLVVLGVTTSLFVAVSVAFGKRDFKFQGLEVPIKIFPLLLIGLTIFHAYLTWLFVNKVEAIVYLSSPISNSKAWASIQNTSGIVFSGMEKRRFASEAGLFDGPAYIISHYDPAAWLSLTFMVVAFIAIISALWNTAFLKMTLVEARSTAALLASSICLANWYIGSQWAIAASILAP